MTAAERKLSVEDPGHALVRQLNRIDLWTKHPRQLRIYELVHDRDLHVLQSGGLEFFFNLLNNNVLGMTRWFQPEFQAQDLGDRKK